MSWGGTGIMDGDGPMDCAEMFSESMEAGYGGYSPTVALVQAIDRDPVKVEELLDHHAEHKDWEYGQVVGLFIIAGGAQMTPWMRRKVLQAIDNDGWDNENRKDEMAKFHKAVVEYDGTPVEGFGYRCIGDVPKPVWLTGCNGCGADPDGDNELNLVHADGGSMIICDECMKKRQP